MDWNNFEPNHYEPTNPDLSSKTKAQALQEKISYIVEKQQN